MTLNISVPPFLNKKRWLQPYFNISAATDSAPTIGRVYLLQFYADQNTIIDGVSIINGSATAGNVTVGVYGPVVTNDTCASAPLVVESASTAVGATGSQTVSLTATSLVPGTYYIAVEYDNSVTMRFIRCGNQTLAGGWSQYYDRGGGYGALTNPCPAVTTSASGFPLANVRCSV